MSIYQGGERLSKREVENELSKMGVRNVSQLGNNTFQLSYLDGSEAIRYHHTDIITKYPDGRIEFNTGGWMTSTTKERMGYLRKFAPEFSIYQKDKIWYLVKAKQTGFIPDRSPQQEWTFKDGITILPDGTVTGAGEDPKATLKLDRRIRAYATAYVDKLLARELEAPGNGDCWYCLMQTEKGQSLGETFKDKEHILSHLDEKYYVPSLVYNAVMAFPVSILVKSELGYAFKLHDQTLQDGSAKEFVREQIRKSIVRFLRRQLGIAS